MTQRKWTAWFLLSVIWVLAHLFIAMIDKGGQLVTHWFYVFGMVLSMMNLGVCFYIGTLPGGLDD